MARSGLVLVFLALSACGPMNAGMDAGADGGASDVVVPGDGALPESFFEPFSSPFMMSSADPRTVQVSASGEALAQSGYDYTAMPPEGEPVFVDGWEVRFDRYLVVVGNVRLNEAGSDPSMRAVVGSAVAQNDGVFLVDLRRTGPITGAGGAPETAHPLLVFRAPSAGGMFDTTRRYAFSYDTLAASTTMRNVNVPVADRSIVEQMIAKRWTHYFSGTATYRGRMASATVDPTFQMYPRTVQFRFGFGAPASYINCHNPELGAEDTPANRGLQPSASGAVRAQLTFHSDHFFWDQAEVEGTPLHFDPFAARAQTQGMMSVVTMDDLQGVSLTMMTDRNNMPVVDRGAQTRGYSGMGNLVYQRNSAMVSDLREFVAYNTRGQGHLNSDGLCFVRANGSFVF